jgi:hypothetical protein
MESSRELPCPNPHVQDGHNGKVYHTFAGGAVSFLASAQLPRDSNPRIFSALLWPL